MGTCSLLQRQVLGEAAEDKQCLARPQGRNSTSPCKRTITLRPSQHCSNILSLFFIRMCSILFSVHSTDVHALVHGTYVLARCRSVSYLSFLTTHVYRNRMYLLKIHFQRTDASLR